MFVQVIQGRVNDAAAVRRRFDKWMSDLAPGSIGWLGSTAGVTDDGMLIARAVERDDDVWLEQARAALDSRPIEWADIASSTAGRLHPAGRTRWTP